MRRQGCYMAFFRVQNCPVQVSGNQRTYPSPKLTLTLTSRLGEGQEGSFPEISIDSCFFFGVWTQCPRGQNKLKWPLQRAGWPLFMERWSLVEVRLYELVLQQRSIKKEQLNFLCYYMRNFCNLIGLEQWCFSVI